MTSHKIVYMFCLMPHTALDQVMEEQGRRNDWLADIVGVHPSLVTRWRNGERTPGADKQPTIALALGRSSHDLFSLPSMQASASNLTKEAA